MKKLKKALAILSALFVMTTAFSCGQTEDDVASSDEPINITSDSETSDEDKDESSSTETSEKDSDNTSEKNDDESSKNTDESSKDESSKADDKSESSSASAENSETSSENSTSSGSNSSAGGSTSGNSSSGNTSSSGGSTGGSSSSGNTSSSGGSTGGSTSSGGTSSSGSSSSSENNSSSSGSSTETPTEEEVVYTAEITLGSSPSATGSNVTVSGQNVLISAGGEYYLKGTLTDGQLQVQTTEKVKLHLDGVNITCSSGPAIVVEDAKRFTIRLMEGTTNTLNDGASNTYYKSVIFSNDTIEIRGKGTLNINSATAHGIASDDDVIIENGNINITSAKTGIHVNDDITVNGGNLTVKGGTNGFKSKGTIHINGGTTIISGGTKEEKSSIYAAGVFTYTGGYLYAAGNLVTAPTESVNPYVVAGFSTAKAAGSNVTLYVNGSEAVSFAPHNAFKCLLMLSPDLTAGSNFTAKVGDTGYGNCLVSSDNSQNIFTLE